MTLTDQHLAIVGLGLIGGSFALRLRGQVARITAVDPNPKVVQAALDTGAADDATTELEAGVCGADIVVLAAPVRAILSIIGQIGPMLPDGCLLIDVGSTKTDICKAMRALPEHVRAVGGHPMAGKETAGLQAADADLFIDRPFVLCPVNHNVPDLAEALVRATGAFPLPMDAERHDRSAAAISHVPYLLSVALVRMVAEVSLLDPWVWTLASTGFGDVSRVAASDVTMMHDILTTNREAVLETATIARDALDMLIGALEGREDALGLRPQLTEAQANRLRWAGGGRRQP